MHKCHACGGTYAPILADGMEYYHACPPLSVAELKAAIQAGGSPLTPAQQAQLAAAQAADVKTPPLPGAPSQADLVLAAFIITRPNARDENVVVTGKDDHGNPIVRRKADTIGFAEV